MSEEHSETQKDYQFLDMLNEKGTVYLVRQRTTGRMLVGRQLTEMQKQLYERIQQAHIPSTPTIRDITKDADGQYLELEDYIQGVALDDWMEQHGAVPEAQAVQIVIELCNALEKLHTLGIIYRDIKPANVIITEDMNAYLVDFDISRIEKDGLQRDTQLLGTTGYAAPEQFGFKQTDCRADIYSLGVMLHQMITGKFPGEGSTSSQIERVVDKCISMEPAGRYANVTELATALGRVVEPQPGYAQVVCKQPETLKPFYRRIPGFRRDNLILEAIAFVFYCFASLVLLVCLSSAFISIDNFVIVTDILAFLIVVYLFIFDCFKIRTRCKAVEKHRGSKWYVLYCAAAMLIWFAICFMVLLIYSGIIHPTPQNATPVQQTASIAKGNR